MDSVRQSDIELRPANVGNVAPLRKFVHDLRSYLNHIIATCELVRDDASDAQREDIVRDTAKIREATFKLNEICSGKLRLPDEPDEEGGEWFKLHLATSSLVNQIIGYADILAEETLAVGLPTSHEDVLSIKHSAELFWDKIQRSEVLVAGSAPTPDRVFSNNAAGEIGHERHREAAMGRILVVDDEEINRDVLARRLQREGYVVEHAGDALSALRRMKETSFDLALLDVMMPGKDGFELLCDIRADDSLRDMRVIMISALNSVDQVAACLEAGADDYLAKPFNSVLLRARIGSSMERKRFHDQELAHIRQLHAERDRLAVTLESITDAVISANMEGRITLMNSAAESLLGWSEEEAHGHHVNSVLSLVMAGSGEAPEDVVARVLTTGEAYMLSDGLELRTRSNRRVPIWLRAAPLRTEQGATRGLVIVVQDVTDRERLAQEMLKAGKAESLGLLAGNIAHEFNNILTSIFGNLSLTRLEPLPERAQVSLGELEESAIRAKDLTRRFLTFARGGDPVKRPLRVSEPIERAAVMIERTPGVDVRTIVQGDLPLINGDPDQLSQALQNLLSNAVEAMPRGGTITITAASETVGEGQSRLPAGEYVRITISDTGGGIPVSQLPLVFDPFFTSKINHNGLGLSAAYSIVRKHEGTIDIESEVNVGTVITIRLPFLGDPDAGQTPRQSGGHDARILIMDDDDHILTVVSELLKESGYRVDQARDGSEALKQIKQADAADDPFDALIIDLVISKGMGGRELIRRIRDMGLLIPALVSSGYSDDPVMANFAEYGFDGSLAKPYKLTDLQKSLNELFKKRHRTAKVEATL